MCQPLEAASSRSRERVSDVTFLTWVLLGATLALAGVIVAYIERRA
jgi:type IV secretory pathway TrbL component